MVECGSLDLCLLEGFVESVAHTASDFAHPTPETGDGMQLAPTSKPTSRTAMNYRGNPMQPKDENPIDINPDRETAETNRLSMQPGPVEENETASAYANRTDQGGVTSLRPERAQLTGRDAAAAPDDAEREQAADESRSDDRSDGPEPLTPAADPMR